MTARTSLLVAASLSVAGLLVFATAGLWGSLLSTAQSDGPSSAAGNEGDRRNAVLRDITVLYVERGKDVSPEMRSGAEFAPMAFLNAELKRQDAKWRVGSVNGPRAEFFEVS